MAGHRHSSMFVPIEIQNRYKIIERKSKFKSYVHTHTHTFHWRMKNNTNNCHCSVHCMNGWGVPCSRIHCHWTKSNAKYVGHRYALSISFPPIFVCVFSALLVHVSFFVGRYRNSATVTAWPQSFTLQTHAIHCRLEVVQIFIPTNFPHTVWRASCSAAIASSCQTICYNISFGWARALCCCCCCCFRQTYFASESRTSL